jgi:hypothetical protein
VIVAINKLLLVAMPTLNIIANAKKKVWGKKTEEFAPITELQMW